MSLLLKNGCYYCIVKVLLIVHQSNLPSFFEKTGILRRLRIVLINRPAYTAPSFVCQFYPLKSFLFGKLHWKFLYSFPSTVLIRLGIRRDLLLILENLLVIVWAVLFFKALHQSCSLRISTTTRRYLYHLSFFLPWSVLSSSPNLQVSSMPLTTVLLVSKYYLAGLK